MIELTALNGIIIFLITFLVNIFGSTTGGSGLLIIPTCIFFNIPPHIAIATTRVGILGSATTTWWRFSRHGKVNYQIGLWAALFSSIGAFFGALCITKVDQMFLKRGFGVLMLAILLITICQNYKGTSFNLHLSRVTLKRKIIGYVLFTLIGFINGIIGGQTIVLMYILMLLFEQSFIKASATKAVINFFLSIIAILVYQSYSIIMWPLAAIIVSGMMLGSICGVSFAMKKGDRFVKYIFQVVILVSAIKLLVFT